MTKEEIKALVREVIVDMSNSYGLATEMSAVANTTANVAGFDAPMGSTQRRKLKASDYLDDEEEE